MATPAVAASRATSALTPRGEVIACTARLRRAIEVLPASEAAALLADLRTLTDRYAPASTRKDRPQA